MNETDDDWHPVRRGSLHRTEVDDDEIVLDRDARLVHQLNPVASHILGRCDGTRTPAMIAESVVARFDVDLDAAREDVDIFLKKLKNLELIE